MRRRRVIAWQLKLKEAHEKTPERNTTWTTGKTSCGQLTFGLFGRKTQFCALIEKAQSKPHCGLGLLCLRTNSDHLSTNSSSTDAWSNATWTRSTEANQQQKGLRVLTSVLLWDGLKRAIQEFKSTAELQQFCKEEWSKMVWSPTIEVVLTPKEGSKIF